MAKKAAPLHLYISWIGHKNYNLSYFLGNIALGWIDLREIPPGQYQKGYYY